MVTKIDGLKNRTPSKLRIITFVFLFLSHFAFNFSMANPASLDNSIDAIEKTWGETYFSSKSDEAKRQVYENLLSQAEQLAKAFPKKAEPLVWKGILLANIAGVLGFLDITTPLAKVADAKKALEDSLALDPKALGGTAYVNLGILYHEVPGKPVSFGDTDKSKNMFEQALKINPDSIDANYNYGKLLEDQDKNDQAIAFYKKALKINPRPNQKYADEQLKNEVLKQLKELDPSQDSEYLKILQSATGPAQNKNAPSAH